MRSKFPSQAEIIRLMNDGWEMGKSDVFESRAWLQKGLVGHGGESIGVHGNTFASMVRKGIVKQVRRNFPTCAYRLTDKYRTRQTIVQEETPGRDSDPSRRSEAGKSIKHQPGGVVGNASPTGKESLIGPTQQSDAASGEC